MAGPSAYSNPPTAGPTIWAVWFAETTHAMARATRARGTTSGTMAVIVGFSNARAAPMTATRARMLVLLCQPPRVPRASAAVAAALTIWQTTAMSRRSQRSATCPTTRVRTMIGTNSARPTSPRSSALPVSA